MPRGKTRYPLYRRLGGPPGLVRTGAENLAPTGIRSPDRPARSQSLYRLRYPALNHWEWLFMIGCKCKSLISTMVESVNCCNNRTNAVSVVGCYVEK